MATKIYSIRFDPDLMARVDACAAGRSEFIRAAVEAALGAGDALALNPAYADVDPAALLPAPAKKNSLKGSVSKGSGVSPVKASGARSGRQDDAAALLSLIGSKRLSPRQAEAETGWLGLRYANAEKLLLSSGAAVRDGGFLVPS